MAPARSKTFEQFLESVRETDASGAAMLSPTRLCDALQIEISALAEQARVHPQTMKVAPQSESVQRYLRDVVRAIKAATDLSGDLDKSLFWYRNHPLQPFHYQTADQVVADGKIDALLRYISMLEVGASG